jgi:hypothetical protein
MIDGMVQRGLAADALSTLQAVIDEASNAERTTNTGLITEVHTVVADVAVEAYKAGILATAGALPFYESETDLASQLVFRADMAAWKLRNVGSMLLHAPEVAELVGTVPSYIPFNAEECTPPEGFTDAHRKTWKLLTKSFIENFKATDNTAWEAIAAGMSYRYGRHLKAEGMEGDELFNKVRAFEIKQLSIIRESTLTGELRQPDQDDHAFEHYLKGVSSACAPVWAAMTDRRRARMHTDF